MKECPKCGEDMEMISFPKSYTNTPLYISKWVCKECGFIEEVEPDWDSMKGGPDHE